MRTTRWFGSDSKTFLHLVQDCEDDLKRVDSEVAISKHSVRNRKPKYMAWVIGISLTSGLLVGAVYLIDKNTSLFLSFRKQ